MNPKGMIPVKKIVFVVDDNYTNLTMAEEVLYEHYTVISLNSAEKMFKALAKFRPDLILLDVEMPESNGFDAIKQLKADETYAAIPVIFLTRLSDAVSEAHGIELGAVDFVMKPFSAPVLLNRIKHHLFIDELIRERTEQLSKRTEQLVRLQNSIVFTLADVVENRDENTGGHIDRTAVYVKILINAMIRGNVCMDEMLGWDLDSIVSSARLHDLGKVAISDSILNKPGKLTNEEFSIIKTHCSAGEQIIDHMIERTGDADFLNNAKLFAAYHHEKWNGSGYPYGLKEKEIPLQGRIMAFVDVYDALTSERPYKKAMTHDEALAVINEDAGKHFDPQIAKVFNEISAEIKEASLHL
jgi:putative two-component system response regulator